MYVDHSPFRAWSRRSARKSFRRVECNALVTQDWACQNSCKLLHDLLARLLHSPGLSLSGPCLLRLLLLGICGTLILGISFPRTGLDQRVIDSSSGGFLPHFKRYGGRAYYSVICYFKAKLGELGQHVQKSRSHQCLIVAGDVVPYPAIQRRRSILQRALGPLNIQTTKLDHASDAIPTSRIGRMLWNNSTLCLLLATAWALQARRLVQL